MSIKALQEYTYISKYARYNKEAKRRETWIEATERVKEMHLVKYADRIAAFPELQEEIDWAFEMVRQRRVLGSQRCLQFGGKPVLKKNARAYNCFREDTPFITSHGVRTFADFSDGDKIMVLTHKGNWMSAIVRAYGKQQLNRVTIKRGKASFEVDVTANHRWLLKGGTETTELKEGDRLAFGPNIFNDFTYESALPDEKLYWAYGFVYGDGTKTKDEHGIYRYSMVRLCGDDVKYLPRFEELGFSSSSSHSLQGDTIVYTGKYLKTLPDLEEDSPRLIRAFVRGFLDADGEKNKNDDSPSPYVTIQATGAETILFIRKAFPVAGVYLVSEEDLTGQETNFGIRTEQTVRFRIVNGFGQTAANFSIDHIEENVSYETVWCLEVEGDHSFVLPNGLVTGNCTVSYCDRIRFFQEGFWLLLCGCGVGFSVQKHHIAKLPEFTRRVPGMNNEWLDIKDGKAVKKFLIPDSIEGWSDALGVLLSSYFANSEFPGYEGFKVEFDFSLIRPAGSSISSGSGKAPGPEPLRKALELIRVLLNDCMKKGQRYLRPIDAYDIMMHASDAVLSGGVRRSATICIFSLDDQEMVTAKTGNWFTENPQRGRSNNSALLLRDKTTKAEFKGLMKSVQEFGEPGFVWADSTESMFNPCVEINLYPQDENGVSGWAFCNLCEINGRKVKSREDWEKAAKAGAILGSLQAGFTDFEYLGKVSENIARREALLGVSITGMMDNPEILFDPKLQKEMAKLVIDTNEKIAPKLGINPTARATCIKPAGTTSCVLGTASGIHPHHAKRYFRRVQGNTMEAPLQFFKEFNEHAVEKSVWSANGTDEIITFCIEVPDGAKVKNDLDAIKLLEYVKLTQQNWVSAGKVKERCAAPWLTHNVSNTINVRPDEWDDVANFIYENRKFFGGISLLPVSGDLDYQQAPMATVHTATEIVKIYGEGSLFASGLIVDGLRAFNNNLWTACDAVLGLGDSIEEPKKPDDLNIELYRKYDAEKDKCLEKIDWIRRTKQFALRYFGDNLRRCLYCLKEVHNWKLWCDLQRDFKEVDYSIMHEENDQTTPIREWACSGGSCQMV